MATTTFSAAGAHRFAQAAGAAGAFSTLRLYDIRDAGRGGVGITDRAVQLEADPGPIGDPAVLAALDGIVDQATMISAIANSLLSCALSGCP